MGRFGDCARSFTGSFCATKIDARTVWESGLSGCFFSSWSAASEAPCYRRVDSTGCDQCKIGLHLPRIRRTLFRSRSRAASRRGKADFAPKRVRVATLSLLGTMLSRNSVRLPATCWLANATSLRFSIRSDHWRRLQMRGKNVLRLGRLPCEGKWRSTHCAHRGYWETT